MRPITRRGRAQWYRKVTDRALLMDCPDPECEAIAGSYCWQVPGVTVGMHVARRLAATIELRRAR